MRNILAAAQREVLGRFARSAVLLAFDYDGTLAPIVPGPGEARMRRRTRSLLARLAELYPVVVISGRARADLLRRLEGMGVREVMGNHGIESRNTAARHAARVRRWLPGLRSRAASLPGVSVEDKTYSVAIHYRRSRRGAAARAAILEAASAFGDARIVGGKKVVNLLPEGAPHKGAALERERERLRCDKAVFVGDDDTDEDVFTLRRPERLLAIRVGRKRSSAAKYFLPGQPAVDDLLRALIRDRETAGSGSRRRAARRR